MAESGSRGEVLRSSRSYYSRRARYRDLMDQLKGKDRVTAKELDFLEYTFSSQATRKVRDVLDLACGGGRHVVGLAKRGYDCTGYDFTPERIEAAKSKAARENVSVRLGVGDATKLDFRNKFDAVLACYILFLLPSDDDIVKCLRCAHKALRKGGVVVCSLFNPFTTGHNWIIDGARNVVVREKQKARGLTISEVQRTHDYDPVKGVLWVDETVFIQAKDDRHVFRDRERARLLTYWDAVHYIGSTGFRDIQCYPDWVKGVPRKPKAEQLVFVATK